MNDFLAVDLFAGAGGMSLGFQQAGFNVKAAVEIDAIHSSVHKINFPSCFVINKSIIDVSGKQIKDLIGDRDIDVIFGGPPCQGFSLMGKRQLEDPRNELVFHFWRLIVDLQPKYFVMENVKGLTLGKHKQFLAELIERFQKSGYEVRENYQVLNAVNYGVPQSRERLFILGAKKGLVLPDYPIASPKKFTVRDAIADLPSIDGNPSLIGSDIYYNPIFGNPSLYSFLLRDFSSQTLTGCMATVHSELVKQRFKEAKPGTQEPISRFFKLDWDGVCNTLRAGTGGDRGSHTAPRPIHPEEPRCITVREAARLHSFPDRFQFHPTKWHGFREIGNAVPPALARAIAQEVMKTIKT